MKNWRKIPFILVLTALWAMTKFFKFGTGLSDVAGIMLVVFVFTAIFVEFFKSGDIGLNTFGMDTAFSVLQVIVCTSAMTILITLNREAITVPDVLLCVVVLADAWFSPFNSFRTALRNWSAQQAGPSSPGDAN